MHFEPVRAHSRGGHGRQCSAPAPRRPRGKKRGEPGCRAMTRGGSQPPLMLSTLVGRSAAAVHNRRGSRRESSNDLAPPLPALPPESSYFVRPQVIATPVPCDGPGRATARSYSVALLPHMCPSPAQPAAVGRSVPRREGGDKVTGRARYTDDLVVAGAWYGRTIRSTIARGRIRSIALDPAFDWSRVVVVTAADIPGDNVVQLIRDDQPVLAPLGGEIRHREEPILLLAAADRATLEDAAGHIRIQYEAAEPIYALEQATEVFSTVEIRKGEVLEDLKGGEDVEVVERTFRVGLQEQLYIEPQGAIAIPYRNLGSGARGSGVTVIASLQCPYYVHRALKRVMSFSDDEAVVIQAETGGGFGGKEEYPSIVAIHAALLARKAGRPVRLVYDRHEDLAATTKRHPGVIRHRTAVTKDGTLLSQDIEIVLDGGAYCTLTPVVLSRAAIHAAGAYSCPNV